MDNIKNISTDMPSNILHDDAAAYENLETERRKKAILSSDTEKFKLFTKLMRISKMMKSAKITNQVID